VTYGRLETQVAYLSPDGVRNKHEAVTLSFSLRDTKKYALVSEEFLLVEDADIFAL